MIQVSAMDPSQLCCGFQRCSFEALHVKTGNNRCTLRDSLLTTTDLPLQCAARGLASSGHFQLAWMGQKAKQAGQGRNPPDVLQNSLQDAGLLCDRCPYKTHHHHYFGVDGQQWIANTPNFLSTVGSNTKCHPKNCFSKEILGKPRNRFCVQKL